jgi:2,4-didehydro-3-deoxy-L-rhamnonate hydrolase
MSEQSPEFSLGCFSRCGVEPFLGLLKQGSVTAVSEVTPAQFGSAPTLRRLLEDWPRSLAALKEGLAADRGARTSAPVEEFRAHAPLPDSRQVFCAGANYRKHVIEMIVALGTGAATEGLDANARHTFANDYVARQVRGSSPYVFMKTVTSIAGPSDDLVLPPFSTQIDWEIELAAVFGQPTYQIARQDALSSVAGYMIVNDLTARDRVRRTDPGAIGPDWLAAKGAPGFLPTGPYFVPAEFISNPHDLRMRLRVNGKLMQDDRTSDMTFDIPRQIEFIASYVKILPGDILCTGSPAGNGVIRGVYLQAGDIMEAEIERLGRQRIRCVSPSTP